MAVQELKRKGGQVMGAVNVVGSAIGRECGHGIFLHAGPEVAVASTKALTNMAVNFALLALLLGRVRDLSAANGARIVSGLRGLPSQVDVDPQPRKQEIAAIAHRYAEADHMFFIGRVRGWPVAREGAQKLKEISYVHAEAYQAGELKHGPLALIQPEMPSVVIIPSDDLVAKNISTIEQIKARSGPVIALTSADIPDGLADATDPGAAGRARARADPVQHPAADPRLPRRREARPRHRQAPQPGQERHGRVSQADGAARSRSGSSKVRFRTGACCRVSGPRRDRPSTGGIAAARRASPR